MLYDADKQSCMWEDQVTKCRGNQMNNEEDIIPLKDRVPTLRPTMKPNSLLEWGREDRKHDKTIIGECLLCLSCMCSYIIYHPFFNIQPSICLHASTGYYASWQWYDRDGLAAPINMDFSKITRANFAFFQITTDGEIFGTDSWADPITLFGMYDWMSEGEFLGEAIIS